MTRRTWLKALLGITGVILTHEKAKSADIGVAIPPDPRSAAGGRINPPDLGVPGVHSSHQVVSYRQPSGHTHSCARCGEVWDHAKNPGHTCQACGASQYIQDNPTKMVPVRTTVSATTTPTTAPTAVKYQLQSTASGCASGNCPLPQKRGLFR